MSSCPPSASTPSTQAVCIGGDQVRQCLPPANASSSVPLLLYWSAIHRADLGQLSPAEPRAPVPGNDRNGHEEPFPGATVAGQHAIPSVFQVADNVAANETTRYRPN